MLEKRSHHSDVLVIGGGVAGLCAARKAAEAGASVVLVTKGAVDGLTNSTLIGRWISRATEATADALFEEVVYAGGYLGDQQLVETLAQGVAQRIPRLKDELGLSLVAEDMWGSERPGEWLLDRVPGHSNGYGLTHPLWEAAQAVGVTVVEHCQVLRLLKWEGRVVGAVGIDHTTGELVVLGARVTVLATGGGARVMPRSDNAPGTTGDGYLLACGAGAELIDMEFISFWTDWQHMEGILTSGTAPNDELLRRGRCHYFLGGVRTDVRAHTTVPGLLAAGEVTGGLFGSARLAGSAIADTLVFGEVAGEEAGRIHRVITPGEIDDDQVRLVEARIEAFGRDAGTEPDSVLADLRALLWRNAGMVKSEETLVSAREGLAEMARTVAEQRVTTPQECVTALDACNVHALGQLVVEASILRKESRGTFWRVDYPEPDQENWLRSIVLQSGCDGLVARYASPVHNRLIEPEMPPMAPSCLMYRD